MSLSIADMTDDAEDLLKDFIQRHHSAAIPCLMGVCVMWAVENGGGELIRSMLANLSKMSVEMEAEIKKASQ